MDGDDEFFDVFCSEDEAEGDEELEGLCSEIGYRIEALTFRVVNKVYPYRTYESDAGVKSEVKSHEGEPESEACGTCALGCFGVLVLFF